MLIKDLEYQIDQLQHIIRTYKDIANEFKKDKEFVIEGRIRSAIEISMSILDEVKAYHAKLEKELKELDGTYE